MQNLKSIKKRYKNSFDLQAMNFICAAVGCNCLVALSQTSLLKKIISKNNISNKEIEHCDNPVCVKSIFTTLEKCNIAKRTQTGFKFTKFGKCLCNYIGLITIFFDGYGALVANQSFIVNQKKHHFDKFVRWANVAKSSIQIAEKTVDPILIKEFSYLKFSGTICDLGCGHGVMLSKLCSKTGNPGLGFESNSKTVKEAKKRLSAKIALEVADVTKLEGIWEDVVILVQAFVFHDFNPVSKCIKLMNSYIENFPNLKYFFYVDIVSPSITKNELFPGFDYIHGLLGIAPRTYEETLEMFEQSNYRVAKEIAIPNLPNTFLWILTVHKENKNVGINKKSQ